MLGFLSDGDWRGFINNVPGPLWLVYALLTIALLITLFMLWKIVPHIYRLLMNEGARIRSIELESTSKAGSDISYRGG